jgi:predicted GTPase
MSNRILIMGAAGRDFHNFNVFYRDNPDYEVVAFLTSKGASTHPNYPDRVIPPVSRFTPKASWSG